MREKVIGLLLLYGLAFLGTIKVAELFVVAVKYYKSEVRDCE